MNIVVLALLLHAAQALPAPDTWQVEGATREAIVIAPTVSSPDGSPLVFVFHGHGGNIQNAARRMALHAHWPEAVVVYPQGLPTPGRYDPQGTRNGWQKTPGDQQDRDLKFFDVMLAGLKERFTLNDRRVYATGHSNGGGFTYLLWSQRPDVWAAMAPSAAGARNVRALRPLPAMHLAGQEDRLAPFENQQRTMAAVRTLNGCEAEGQPWAEHCLLYRSPQQTPFVSYVHPGGHEYPTSATPLVVKFFQEHTRR